MPESPSTTAYLAALEVISSAEPDVAAAIGDELSAQRRQLKLIASENYASPAVLLAMGNWLSDKYAEGVPGRRMYAGCEVVDRVEELAAAHARALFGADFAYVQPHSGIDANLVAYWAILARRIEAPFLQASGVPHVNDLDETAWHDLRQRLGNQRMLGMSLDAGGHLTHGFRPNISGKMFEQSSYGVDPETGLLDYDAVSLAAREIRPLILVAGYSAYPRLIDFARLAQIAADVGATFMVDMAHFAEYVEKGCPMVLGGPLGHVMAAKAVALAEARRPEFATYAATVVDNARALADGLVRRGARILTGGTDNHLVVVDVATSYGLTGRQAESALLDAGVVTNRNSIPADPNGAWYTSGIRLGTPALTTLGFGAAEMGEVADIIATTLGATTAATAPSGPSKARYLLEGSVADTGRRRSADLLARFPLYPELTL